MSRENYPLSDETRVVLSDNVTAIADEMNVHTSFLYQMLSSVECDSFAKFRRLYAACVRAGADTTAWDASLASIRNKHRSQCDTHTECLSKKIALDAATTAKMVEALEDGEISDSERQKIRLAIQRERASLDNLDALLEPSPTVREFAKSAVANRKNGGR